MSKVMKIEAKSEEILTEVAENIKTSQEMSPDELAEQKIEQQLNTDQDYSAAAGALFALYGTRLYASIDQLKTNQLKRILKTLCVYPLEDQYINTKNPVEKNAYLLADRMIESKFLIKLHLGFEAEEKRKKAAEEYKLAQEANVSPETLNVIDESVKNLENGLVGDPINLEAKNE